MPGLNRFLGLGPRRTCLVALAFAAGVGLQIYGQSWLSVLVLSLIVSAPAIACRRLILAGCLAVAPLIAFHYASVRVTLPPTALTNGDAIDCSVRVDRILSSSADRFKAVARLTSSRGAQLAPGTLAYLVGSVPAGRSMRVRLGVPGQLLRVRGHVQIPQHACHPWEFDERRYLDGQGVQVILRARSLAVRRDKRTDANESFFQLQHLGFEFDRLSGAMRTRLVKHHEKILGFDLGRLLASMVIGERAVSAPDSIVTDFQNLGLSHVLAASGFNLSIVTGMAYFAARLVTANRLFLMFSAFAAMLSFLALAGLSPSVERAALVASMILLSRLQSRSLHAPAALGLALVLTLMFNPALIADVGLQLSYMATAALIGFSQAIDRLAVLVKGKIVAMVCQAAAAIMVAQMSVLPLQMLYFWRVSLLFLPANLLVAPAVLVATAGGFASSLCLCLSQAPGDWLSALIDRLLTCPLSYILWVVATLLRLGPSVLSVGPPSAAAVAAFYASAVVLWAALAGRRYKLAGALVLVLTVTTASLFWRPARPNLLVASFKQSLAIIDSRGDCLVSGNQRSLVLERFLRYQAIALSAREPIATAGRLCLKGEALPVLIVGARELASFAGEPSPQQAEPPILLVLVRFERASDLAESGSIEQLSQLIAASHAPLAVLTGLGRRQSAELSQYLQGCQTRLVFQKSSAPVLLEQARSGSRFEPVVGSQRLPETGVTSVSSSTR